ncbi:TRAP transporter large permease [Pollutimonas sp. M17]|uniref:TRAP transporter large permease n=1 Tax=Pollutimonas sp. M17 TaxID=2962065 RepID=UPI0021F4663B|nr:TRAP transporter large permease subunit [Pollutimonas sp. M17]UYO93450.1 TRAP transporter large permease subunit [Pollutimonas sp. M17]HWK71754.1 TRAP transporter large permease subunit [Burkholderiaceae bacterium]
MSLGYLTLLVFGALISALIVGLPIAFATGAVAVVMAVWLFDLNTLNIVVSRVFTLMGNNILLSVPLFILMANILEKAGIAEDIFKAAYIWSGKLRGGLAIAVVISCALMAAMVGVIGAEIVTMGVVALPAMLKRGYGKSLALGSICAGGGLSTLIPPSVVFIMYALTSGTSIGQLYMAGVFPGLLLGGLYILYIVTISYLKPEIAPTAPPEELEISFVEKLGYVKNLILPGLVAFSVLGSLYLGWATPTEAAGVGVVGALVAALVNRRFTWQGLYAAVVDTTKVTCMLYWLFFGASVLVGVYTMAGGTQYLKEMLLGLPGGKWGVLITMNLIWIVLGCVVDWIGILLLTAPVFVPVAVALGFDPIWLGVLFCMNMQISYISPPFGPAAFYLKGAAPEGISIGDIFRSVWPFLGLQFIALGLVIAFPAIALWLPQTMIAR